MPEQVSDLEEHLRRLRWEIQISRDSLLKVAEGLPDSLVGHSQRLAERLTVIQSSVRKTSEALPTDVDLEVPESVSENLAGMRENAQGALREIDLLIAEIHEIFKGMPALRVN
jgi:hypothetical protein